MHDEPKYTDAFYHASIRAAFEHGYYAGHADAKARMERTRVTDRTDKYMALTPVPAFLAASRGAQ